MVGSHWFTSPSLVIHQFPLPIPDVSALPPCVFHAQNLVIVLSTLVDWLIPDVPKDISAQVKMEKTLLVDAFLHEEKDKLQLIQSLFLKDKEGHRAPAAGQLPAQEGGGGPRARGRAASFSQFSSQPSPGTTVKHTEV